MVDGTPQALLDEALQLEDPERALATLAALRARLATIERIHVRNAREAGRSWSQVAKLLGVTKQALHKKHAAWIAERPPPAVPEPRGAHILLTAEARRAVRYAREEARARGHFPVGTGHLLLGLLRDPDSAPARVLTRFGVTLARARPHVDRLLGAVRKPERPAATLPVSKGARRVLEQSLHEAVRRSDTHLGTEHLLLALLREERGVAVETLRALGVSHRRIERGLTRELEPQPVSAAG